MLVGRRGWSRNNQDDAYRRVVLDGLLVASSIGFSLGFACATPFAAFATVAALKLGRRGVVSAVGVVWLLNQAIGYTVLRYPCTWDSLAWGIAIMICGYLAWLAAVALSSERPVGLAVSLPFLGAFAVYELGLFSAGFVLPSGSGAFAASVVERIFIVNLVALFGLLALCRIALTLGLMPRPAQTPWLPALSR